MKRILKLSAIAIGLCFLTTYAANDQTIQSSVDIVESKLDECCSVVNSKLDLLSPEFLTSCTATGNLIVITTPGFYQLATDLACTVSVVADSVVLDLNNYTLRGRVELFGDHDIVKNGFIMPPAPTTTTEANQAALTVNRFADFAIFDHLIIDPISTVTQTGTGAGISGRPAVLNRGDETFITDCFLRGGDASSSTAASASGGTGGRAIFNDVSVSGGGDKLIVQNTRLIGGNGGSATGSGAGGGGGGGLSDNGADDIKLINCIISTGSGGSTDSGSGGGGGFAVNIVGVRATVLNSVIQDMGGGGDSISGAGGFGGHGFQLGADALIENCTIKKAGDGGDSGGAITGALGGSGWVLGLRGVARNTTIVETGNGGNATGTGAGGQAGSGGSGTDSLIENCLIKSTGNGGSAVSGTGGQGAIGLFSGGGGNIYRGCTIQSTGNGGSSSTGAGGAAGRGILHNAGNNLVQNCTINGTGDGGSGGTTGGAGGFGIILALTGTNNVVEFCTIGDTGSGGAGGSGTGGAGGSGVLVGATVTSSRVSNCVINGTGLGGAGTPAGINGRAIFDQSVNSQIYANQASNITGTPIFVTKNNQAVEAGVNSRKFHTPDANVFTDADNRIMATTGTIIALMLEDIVNGTLTLNQQGGVYELVESVTANVVIDARNVVFDMSGFTLVGTVSLTDNAHFAEILDGLIQPEAPTSAAEATTPAIFIGVVDNAEIHDLMIECASTTTQDGSGNGIDGRSGIIDTGVKSEIFECSIRAGDGAATSVANGNGGNGGAGLILRGNSASIFDLIFRLADGGDGAGTGAAGDGGSAIVDEGTNSVIEDSLVFNSGKGGDNPTASGGGRAGSARPVIHLRGVNAVVQGNTLNSGDGGLGSTTDNSGDGGPGITVHEDSSGSFVLNNTINKTGDGRIGGDGIQLLAVNEVGAQGTVVKKNKIKRLGSGTATTRAPSSSTANGIGIFSRTKSSVSIDTNFVQKNPAVAIDNFVGYSIATYKKGRNEAGMKQGDQTVAVNSNIFSASKNYTTEASGKKTMLSTASFNSPIVFSTPGENIIAVEYIELVDNEPADIIITASNVTLDLNGFTLLGTVSIADNADHFTIMGGTIRPLSPTTPDEAAQPAIWIGNAIDTFIYHVSIDCMNSTGTQVDGTGLNGRSGIIDTGFSSEIYECIIRAGAGAPAQAGAGDLPGGTGGDGIQAKGTGCHYHSTVINDGGDGGAGEGAGVGGDGGSGIAVFGTLADILKCTVDSTGNGGNASGVAGSAGHGIFVRSTAANALIDETAILSTGVGGVGATGGNGGDAIKIESGASNIRVTDCDLMNTGTGGVVGGVPGKAIDDDSSNSAIFSNLASNIANTIRYDIHASGAETGKALSECHDVYDNVYDTGSTVIANASTCLTDAFALVQSKLDILLALPYLNTVLI